MIDTSRTRRRTSLLIAVAAILVAIVVWNIPALDFALYPLRLFVTFIHETGHGLTALLTGGQFANLTVYANGAGVATTAGGTRWLILPAGYLGAALFGAGLFFVANTTHRTRLISAVLAVVVALMALLYAQWLSTAWLVGLGFAIALTALAWKGNAAVNLWVLNVLAVLCGLNAVVDLLSLVNNSGAGMGSVRNDAAAFSTEVAPLIPAWGFALCWAGIALVLMGAAIWYSLGRKARRVVDDAATELSTSKE